MNGTLDGDTDLIPLLPEGLDAPLVWYKTTISSFSLADQMAVLEDEGYKVRPLLIVRDVRAVWASLTSKPYGRNGVTAEDPPLRLRFRRFLRSWQLARKQEYPIIRFEDFISRPEPVLRRACQALDLAWQPAMIDWPDPGKRIADGRHGNRRFRESNKRGLAAALHQPAAGVPPGPVHAEDLTWLDETFASFNQAMGYPRQLDQVETLSGRLEPQWNVSRRLQWRLRQKPFRYLLNKLGLSRYRPRPQ